MADNLGAAPDTAPSSNTHSVSSPAKTRLGVSAWAILVFCFALGHTAVLNLVGIPAKFALDALLIIVSVVVFVRTRPERFRWYRVPAPLYWFLGWAALSLIWSQYRFETTLGVIAQIATTAVAIAIAYVLSWHELLRTLGTALRYLIGLSFVFELWVAVFVRAPLLPWWIVPPEGTTPRILYWSRNLLFEGGKIQGVVGNSTLFAFIGLIGLIVFAIQLRASLVRRANGMFWIALAVLTLLLTRSATIWVALAAVVCALGLAVWARRLAPERRLPLYLTGGALVAAVALVLAFARDSLWGLLGKSGDLTGRTEIWEKVWGLVQEHPVVGWGWVSHWATWVPPFKGLDVKAGMPVQTAENAWLDVWLQLGIIGVLVFAPLVLLTLLRTWSRAVDQPRRGAGPPLPYATSALWPWLVMVVLLVQSLTTSELLFEGGWLLLVILAVKTRFDFQLPALDTEPTKLPWRRVPIARGTGATER